MIKYIYKRVDMINTVIFDLDDTLYKELDFVCGAFKEVCKYLAYKYNINEEDLYEDMIYILNKFGRGKTFNMLCEKHNLKENIKNLVSIYREAKPSIRLYEDAQWILNYLKKNKINTGIITDGKASVQWNKINCLNLIGKVDKIIVSDDFGLDFWKPHEFTYREMLKYFNCNPDDCIYIGDNPNKDFIGAKKVGVHTVRVIREVGDHMKTFLDKEYEADVIIKDLRELYISQ